MSDLLGTPAALTPDLPAQQPAQASSAYPVGAPQPPAQPDPGQPLQGYPQQAAQSYSPPPQGYPQQAYGYGQPAFNVNVAAPAIVMAPPSGPGFGVRAVWFVFIGWWLTGFMIGLAYFLALTIIGLPVAFYLFNRIPIFLTLRGRTKTYRATMGPDGTTTMLQAVNTEQRPMLQRALWFIFVGWWLGALWMGLAYVLCVIIIGLPIGLMMFDRTGGVMTLLRY